MPEQRNEARTCGTLDEVRAEIDRIDRAIVRLLGERAGYVRQAGRFKTSEQAVRAPDRRQRMQAKRRAWAEADGLDPAFVERLFDAVTEHFIGRELDDWRRDRAAPGAPNPTED